MHVNHNKEYYGTQRRNHSAKLLVRCGLSHKAPQSENGVMIADAKFEGQSPTQFAAATQDHHQGLVNMTYCP